MKQNFLQWTKEHFSSMILNNQIPKLQWRGFDFEYFENSKDDSYNIFQYFIVEVYNFENLEKEIKSTNQVLMYCEELNLYILGVTHFGTPWEDVTDF